jgi:hypothetical protein
MKLTTSRGATVATIFTAILVIASLCSIIIMQTSNASASNVIYKQKIRGDVAVAQKTIKEGSTPSGSIFTTISAKGFTTPEGDKQLCVSVRQADPDEADDVFQGCGPAQRLTIGLGKATFGGRITGFDFTTGEEKTVTVNAELTATGKAETSKFSTHTNNRDINEVFHSSGKIIPASGSLNIGGGITLSADDAVGIISKFAVGTIQVTKN